MIGFLFATLREAEPFLQAVQARRGADGPVPTYVFAWRGGTDDGVVVLSGMGPDRAAAATTHLIQTHHPDFVVNAGACGTLGNAVAVGDVVRVSEVFDGDMVRRDKTARPLPCPGHAGPGTDLPTARLASVTEPVFDADERDRLAAHADLVEMEGFAVAQVCHEAGVPFVLIKGVSDRADLRGKDDIQRHIDRVSSRIAEHLVQGLEGKVLDDPENGAHVRPAGATTLVHRLLRYTKIEHTVFSLPFLFAGAWLGWGGAFRSLQVMALVILAGVGARVLGMSMNRILDRHLDALNPRTRNRELPAGSLSLATAWMVSAAGGVLYLASCALLGGWCLILFPIPLVPLLSYPLLKRFTPLCHFGVGAVLAIAPLGAYVATAQSIAFDSRVLWLAVLTFCWLSGSDIVYALMDRESDLQTGVRSMAVAFGVRGALGVAGGLHLVAVAAMGWLLLTSAGRPAGWISAMVAAAAFGAMYVSRIPLPTRFFPISAVAGVASALVPILGGMA